MCGYFVFDPERKIILGITKFPILEIMLIGIHGMTSFMVAEGCREVVSSVSNYRILLITAYNLFCLFDLRRHGTCCFSQVTIGLQGSTDVRRQFNDGIETFE